MRSSNIFKGGLKSFRAVDNLSYRWTQRKKNTLVTSRIMAKSGGRRVIQKWVRVYDFVDKRVGKANPYGVYDTTANVGWVSVGVDHDTAEFAVETLRRWWEKMGRSQYPAAAELLVTADGGGSNGTRVRLWKVALQRLADQTGLRISVCHFPPGTEQMEQDRAPNVQLYQPELAWKTLN